MFLKEHHKKKFLELPLEKIFCDEKGEKEGKEEEEEEEERKNGLACSEEQKKKIDKKKKKKEESDRWESEEKSDLTRLVGPNNVCLFTKMSWKLSFHNLKTHNMCFPFC